MTPEHKNEIREIFINLEGDAPEIVAARTEIFGMMNDEQIAQFELEHFGASIPTVNDLRKAGYRVWVNHQRRVLNRGIKSLKEWRVLGVSPSQFYAKGGSTSVEILSPEGETYHGQSRCSREDNFCRKDGLFVAIARSGVTL